MIVLMLMTGVMMNGCAPAAGSMEVQDHIIGVTSGDTVRLTMQEGYVRFTGHSDTDLEISGTTTGQLTWAEVESGVEITVEGQGNKAEEADAGLEIKIPEGVILDISTYNADIVLENMNGQVKAVSVAGDVTASALTGDIFLKSGRGDVQARDCTGHIRVLGEHGVLQMIDLHGDIASATIMGTVDFNGSIGEGDDVFLETDHGPVLVKMTDPVNMQVKAWTASGEVACMLPELTQTVDGCVGRVGDGASGTLTVKTVSGKIWLENAP